MHLDPDFNELTYGDVGDRRGREIAKLTAGDLLVFYAGLKPIRPCGHRLLYALTGFYVVDEVLAVGDVPSIRWHENAHTRRLSQRPTDIVVRARRGVSGRLTRCVAIGEWRDRAYRVRQDVLDEWGGLSVKDGYLQRSAVPPNFLDAEQFYRWFGSLGIPLVAANNAGV
jgi:hypothetical protein